MPATVISLTDRIDRLERADWEREQIAEKWELLDEAMAIVDELPRLLVVKLMSACRIRLRSF